MRTWTGFVWNGLWVLELAAVGDSRVNIEGDVKLELTSFRPHDSRSAVSPPRGVFSLFHTVFSFFSEPELTSTFAIRCRLSVCLSVVCNVRASYSGGSIFWQYFYGIRYDGHPLTFVKSFTEIVPGEPSAEGVKHKRGSQV